MKATFYAILTVLILLVSPLKAQWERTKGPSYGGVTSMAYQAPYLFATTMSGLFRTSDNGLNWEQVKGLPDNRITGVVAKGNKVIVSCWYFGIYISSDAGNTWDKAGTEMPIGSITSTLPTMPYYRLYATTNYIYCGVGGIQYKLYRSSDDGKSWQLFLSNQYVDNMIQDGDTILINNTTNTIRSINNGASFSAVTGLSPGINNTVKLGKINNTWVGALPNTSNPFRYSTNGGASFSNGSLAGTPPYSLNNIVTVGNKIFISSSAGIYQSSDGISWSMMPTPAPLIAGATDGYRFMFENNGDFWCGSYQFYLSQDTGASFSIRNYGLNDVSDLLWYNYNPSDNFLYTTETFKGKLLRSADHGDTWNAVGAGLPSKGTNSKFIVSYASTYFAGTDSGLYTSADNANNWSKVTNGLPAGSFGPTCMIQGNTELYLGTVSSGVYKSSDNGSSWSPANTGFTNYNIYTLQWHQNKLYAGTPGGLLMSADSGASWNLLNSSLSATDRRVVNFAIRDDSIFTCFNYSKIFRSSDWGNTWNLLNPGVNTSSNVPGEVYILDSVYFYSCPFAIYGVNICSFSNPTWIPINTGLNLDTTYTCPQPKEMTADADFLYLNGDAFNCYRLPLNSILVAGRLSGAVYWDKNGNGTRQSNEPFLNDERLTAYPDVVALDTDTSGIYRYYYFGNTPTYTIQLQPKPYWVITSSPSPKVITPLGHDIDTLNFGVNILYGITDIKATLNTIDHRPGSHPVYFLTITNQGTDTISNTATVTLDNNLTYVSGSPYQNINGNTLTFSFTNLRPGQSTMFYMVTSLSTGILPGTVLNSTAIAYPLAGDTIPANNFANCLPLVMASFDPNNKTVEPAGNIGNQDLLTYQVNFQNTGNDTAFTVIIRDTLATSLDPTTYQFITASHPVTWSVKNGNILEFRFDHILLPDSTTNEPQSHGFVRFSILPMAGLPLNTIIQNTAAIYFDYNTPVITNNTSSTITGITGISYQSSPNTIGSQVQPNPFSTETVLKINCSEVGDYILKIRNTEGKIIRTEVYHDNVIRITNDNLSGGIYFYEIQIPSGTTTNGKFVVE